MEPVRDFASLSWWPTALEILVVGSIGFELGFYIGGGIS
jgi:hypothetical protein